MRVQLILICLALLMIEGCVTTSRQVLNGNIFHSAINPQLNIKVDPAIKYLGKMDNMRTGDGIGDAATLQFKSSNEFHFFAEAGKNNIVKRFVIVQIKKQTQRGWIFTINTSETCSKGIKYGNEKIGRWDYQYCMTLSGLNKDFADFFISKSLFPNKIYVQRFSVRTFNSERGLVSIFYGEDCSELIGDLNKSVPGRVQKVEEFVAAFVQRFRKNCIIE